MNVSLTPELEAMIHERVRTGRYTSASEVVREALRLLMDRDELRALHLAETRARVAEGLAAIDAGDVHDGDTVFAEILADTPSQRAAS